MSENLFQQKRFKMHSGGMSDFKLECDALTEKDYQTLAYLVSRKFTFQKCYGIPRGGLPFAKALSEYSTKESNTILIVDDVLTTGKSIIDFKNELLTKNIINVESKVEVIVLFSRGKLINGVTSIFSLNEIFWQND